MNFKTYQTINIATVFVCTPDYLPEEHAIAAMEAGKDVFLEKPMAISIEGCDRILRVREETGRKLYMGYNMRFYPVMQKMRQLIESGRIGRVETIWCRHFINYGGDANFKHWHSERKYTTGLLQQEGAHDIDIIHHLAGSSVSDPCMVEDFLRMLRGQPTTGATPLDARMVAAVGCLATKSIRNGSVAEAIPEINGCEVPK